MNELQNFRQRNRNQPPGNTLVLDFERASVEVMNRIRARISSHTSLNHHDVEIPIPQLVLVSTNENPEGKWIEFANKSDCKVSGCPDTNAQQEFGRFVIAG